MSEQSTILQRDQRRKPTLNKYTTNGQFQHLSSPFSFNDFGFTSKNISQILQNIKNDSSLLPSQNLINKPPEGNNNNAQNDIYQSPLTFQRLKSAKCSSNNQNPIYYCNNNSFHFKSNEFPENYFLRTQSTKNDQMKPNDDGVEGSKIKLRPKSSSIYNSNIRSFQNQAPIPVKNKNTVQQPKETLNNAYGIMNAKAPVINTQTGSQFYVKSYKTEALIYNPTNNCAKKSNSINSIPEKCSFNIKKSSELYNKAKMDAEDYRIKQRELEDRKKLAQQIKEIQPDQLFKQDSVLSIIKTPQKTELIRPKSVTFSDKVQQHNFVNSDSEDDSSLSESICPTKTSTDDNNDSSDTITDDDSESDDDDKEDDKISVISTQSENATVASTPSFKEEEEENLSNNQKIEKVNEQSNNNKNESEIKPCCEAFSSSLQDSKDDQYKISDEVIVPIDSKKEMLENKSIESTSPLPNIPVAAYNSDNTATRNTPVKTSPSAKESTLKKEKTTNEISTRRKFSDSRVNNKSCISIQDLKEMRNFKETQLNMPLIFSKFSNVPPVVNFVSDGEKIEQLPWQLRKLLKWRTSLLTPIIVKQTITRSGFRPSRSTTAADDLESTETCDWILYFGKHMKGPVFQTIKDHQKVNHFPGSFQLGRKDRLWRNICRMQQEVNQKEYDFIPQTFCLPTDLEVFRKYWEEEGGEKCKWIIKPPASARGIGVKVVHKWNQIPKKRPVVVQKYISNPYLINDSKFDLRLYVLVTCVDPLCVYLYNDGLVRFASTKYSNSLKTLHNRYVHLTNYSINKFNTEYLDNSDSESCRGHKWSLRALWQYLRMHRSVNTESLWRRISDLVLKTLLSAEDSIAASTRTHTSSKYSVQELFGFDVILDENLKPWILEVNVSPSLHSDSPLDITVKGGMIKDMFNLIGFLLPEPQDLDNNSIDTGNSCDSPISDLYLDRRVWNYKSSINEIEKQKYYTGMMTDDQNHFNCTKDKTEYYLRSILNTLTPGDIRMLLRITDEYERRGHFERIFPMPPSSSSSASIRDTMRFLSCFQQLKYSNLLLTAFSYKYTRNQGIRLVESLCQKKLHILSTENGDRIDKKHIWSPNST